VRRASGGQRKISGARSVSYPLTDIEGIDEAIAARLKQEGIRSSDSLLEVARTSRGRKALAQSTGIDEKQLLCWANIADCMRIRGVSREYADLLHAAGVYTVKEIKYRNPRNLAAAMAEANRRRKLVKVLPSEKVVVRWIDHARKLPVKITY
jgi:predicted flap endonuclease-1-like 5' DNA nuclease